MNFCKLRNRKSCFQCFFVNIIGQDSRLVYDGTKISCGSSLEDWDASAKNRVPTTSDALLSTPPSNEWRHMHHHDNSTAPLSTIAQNAKRSFHPFHYRPPSHNHKTNIKPIASPSPEAQTAPGAVPGLRSRLFIMRRRGLIVSYKWSCMGCSTQTIKAETFPGADKFRRRRRRY